MNASALERPWLGYGLGLRKDHYRDIIDNPPEIDWFEILTENYLVPGGKPLYYLDQIAERYPTVMHGVSLSIGSIDPLDMDYLRQVKQLAERTDSLWISDHLCWTGAHGINAHDLLPLPYTEETLRHVTQRVEQVQDYLEQRILLENASTYLEFSDAHMTEWEFLSALAEEADCLLLLDVNNIHVSATNNGFDSHQYLAGIPAERVWQIHLAGHSDYGDYLIDTHDAPIADPVWALYHETVQKLGATSVMIERDDNIPPLETLLQELHQLRKTTQEALGDAT
ncbi:MAG: MNIO family bufferin maturase [bacterium]